MGNSREDAVIKATEMAMLLNEPYFSQLQPMFSKTENDLPGARAVFDTVVDSIPKMKQKRKEWLWNYLQQV